MQFRKSRSFGGLRLTASKKGLGVSFGKGPFRVSLGADGKVRRTVRVPGTGIHDTKVVGKNTQESPETRTAVFEADESPACTGSQIAWVELNLKGKVVEIPDLSELTVYQAEQMLYTVGVDPATLYQNGRMLTKAKDKEQAAWAARFGI